MDPKATGWDLEDEKELASQRLCGTPYTVPACGIRPCPNGNDRQ